MGIFEGDERNDEVTACLLGKFFAHGGDIFKEGRVVQPHFVASLFKSDAEHLFPFDGGRTVGGIHLDNVVGALALLAQDLECLLGVAGCNHAIAHLTFDEQGGGLVAGVAERNEVAIAAHAVGAACSGIGAGNGCQGHLDIIHEINLGQCGAQWQADGSTSGAHVLEAGCCRHSRGFLQFSHQLPAVQCVQEVDVPWSSAQHGEGQFAFLHKDARGFLIGIATILECKFFHNLVCISFYSL